MLINTVGGDVSCGLALAEMLSSLSKPCLLYTSSPVGSNAVSQFFSCKTPVVIFMYKKIKGSP